MLTTMIQSDEAISYIYVRGELYSFSLTSAKICNSCRFSGPDLRGTSTICLHGIALVTITHSEREGLLLLPRMDKDTNQHRLSKQHGCN